MPVLVVDNLSPFTPDILDCLGRLGITNVYRKFSEVSEPELAQCDKVILSGRRKNSKEINMVNSRIIRHCHDGGKPLLGICYGAEIIALTLGGSLRKMPAHVQGTTKVSVSDQNPLTGDKKLISVYESHGYCVAKLPANFKSLASSQYCEHEIFASGKIFGTQFHPEKSGSDGLALLQNFVAKT
ncbi:putative GMP synthase [Candidatus Nitrososphaera gargensis Ga9.2]|uniref:Putative GMP synthase n=1 Tax=Nitrososphaera gargensis (strain Ga9.2) TaxID=1237085 RepID=K0IB33_NITGG|nr:gamma-glutamyl-gamma-aminobutyrate hydrolase family protein [Candidatus Nitrososphaera gargensis]AFU58546.1 putative GMP synthase [Candidatus Nitrososphaera gargensis Ga9.2]